MQIQGVSRLRRGLETLKFWHYVPGSKNRAFDKDKIMDSVQLRFQALAEGLGQQVIGQPQLIERLLIALLADGHLLVEGTPGLAKTRAIRQLGAHLEGSFHRVQFTPDLLPADLTGTEKQIYTHNGEAWNPDPDETRHFVYDGWNLIKETIDKGDTISDKYYVWGLDLSQTLQGAGGVGGLLCVVGNRKAHYYFYDANGNVGQLVDAENGAIAAHYAYDPFGNLVEFSGDGIVWNTHRFSTKYYDGESELYYYGHRYYQTDMGQWVSRDPIGEKGGHNLYGFVWNDGINYSDFLGLALYAFDGTGTDEQAFTHVRMLYEAHYKEMKEYEEGVGSHWYSKILGGITGFGGSLKLEKMYKKLVRIYEAGDKNIDIIGFSRGASLAREFANMIFERGIAEFRTTYKNVSEGQNEWSREATRVIDCKPLIRFVGLFDTVGSFGIPGNYINLGIRMDLPENVQYAAHAVARDEHRAEFPVTQLNLPKVGQHFMQEVFSGDHSDIGGGHMGEQNLLALEPLLYVWEAGRYAGVPLGNIPFEKRERLWGPYKASYKPHDLTGDWKFRSGPQREELQSFNYDMILGGNN